MGYRNTNIKIEPLCEYSTTSVLLLAQATRVCDAPIVRILPTAVDVRRQLSLFLLLTPLIADT